MESMRRMNNSAEKIRLCLEPTTGIPDLRGAYTALKNCHCHTSVRVLNSSRADMGKVTGNSAALYRQEEPTPPGIMVPNHIKHFGIN